MDLPKIAAAALLPALLGGCVVLQTYRPAAGEEMATIEVSQLPDPAFCVDGIGYQAAKDAQGTIRVPANRRISLYSNFHSDDGYRVYTCTAGAGFSFAPGSRLVAALELESRGCRIDLVRLDADTPTGVASEPSLGPALCNPWRPSP